MAIATLATEAKATALITEARRCLAFGVTPQPLDQFLKNVIDQLESATVNDLSGRTNVAIANAVDGRDAAEAAIANA